MEQLQKVAFALMKADEEFSDGSPRMYDFLAEQAIMAMRQPTDEMLQIVGKLPPTHNRLDMWCAMIDVALGRLTIAERKDEAENEVNFGYDD